MAKKLDEELKQDLKELGLGALVTGVSAIIPIPGSTAVAVGAGTYTALQARKVYRKLKQNNLFDFLKRKEKPVDKYFKYNKPDEKGD